MNTRITQERRDKLQAIMKTITASVTAMMLLLSGFTVKDRDLLAEVIYHENWNTDKDHEAAFLTGIVVKNRIYRDDKWLHLKGERTVYDVVYAKGQYSTTRKFFTKEIPEECKEMATKILLFNYDVPKDLIFQATFRQGKVYKVINGEYFCYG